MTSTTDGADVRTCRCCYDLGCEVRSRSRLARKRRSCSATRDPDSRSLSWSVSRASRRAPRHGAGSSRAYQGRRSLGCPRNAHNGHPNPNRTSPSRIIEPATSAAGDPTLTWLRAVPAPTRSSPPELTIEASSSPRRPATVLGRKATPSQPCRAVAFRRAGLRRHFSHS